MVRERGLEPPRFLGHKILSLARLPVPPLPHAYLEIYTIFAFFTVHEREKELFSGQYVGTMAVELTGWEHLEGERQLVD